MTTILAIETSTPACSVALNIGDKRFSRYSEEPRSHTRLIMRMIDDVLREADLTVDQLDAIAVTIGPGSFTGLRIGFSTVQGLAFAADIPVIAVSTLQVIAQTYRRKYPETLTVDHKPSNIIMSVLDARMGEFNCGVYQMDGNGQFAATIDDQLLTKNDAIALCGALNPSVIVGEAQVLIDGENLSDKSTVDIYPDAIDLLDIALVKYTLGAAVSIDQIDLVYLRGTDVWKKHTPLRAL
jgi:tRNA threonylcarbamoyladenosine biosynthesis protein TsaB